MTSPAPSLLSVGFFQSAIIQAAPHDNLERLRQALQDNPPPPATLIVLPELWATGFVYPQLAALSLQTPWVLDQLQDLSARHTISFAGSLVERVDEGDHIRLYNTLFMNDESGVIGAIRKQHLFAFWNENQWLTAGNHPCPVTTTTHGLVGGLICYDLRFPETAKEQCQQGASLLLVSAQWPQARIEQWRILLQARAIENQSFVIAANGCEAGAGMNDFRLGGHSLIIAPTGDILLESGEEECLAWQVLDQQQQKQLRQRFNTVAPCPYPAREDKKIVSLAECAIMVAARKDIGQRIVFTNGCFDILHAGHVEYLQEARKQGDFLVLGLNSDHSIRTIKGEKRPINEESQRARVLAALSCVDAIILFGDDTPLKLITALLPHILVKGADWEEEAIVGAREVKANGGTVVRIPFTTPTSTTHIIAKIKGDQKKSAAQKP